MAKKLFNFNRKDNEIQLLGDFIINLEQSGSYIINAKRSATSQESVHTFIN